ncbi:MAG: hypothetical protein J6S23_04295 [Clostridia bacterium]|nr:hypothetical protein [Clostridia bacterium]
MIDRIERARQFRKSGVAWAKDIPDNEASTVPSLYEGMKYDGSLIKAGTRINWNDAVVKAAVDLWDNEENNPDNAPDLWKELQYKNGIRIIPEVISVTEAFSKDEKGWWGDEIYTSKVDNNVYTPEQYPDNWTKDESGV